MRPDSIEVAGKKTLACSEEDGFSAQVVPQPKSYRCHSDFVFVESANWWNSLRSLVHKHRFLRLTSILTIGKNLRKKLRSFAAESLRRKPHHMMSTKAPNGV
ncbi:hypothetical protein AVEN_115622-1 [Araneus ventricosus]|uniref:Uncharacterized protein n=1 Tax=Araneus ventricosus TaxID=182803 RepID=A0A4Y2GWK2_ARAVE|nr:hypothetical protein AVEN_115622-1 [Araneus ventricosus]